MARKKKTDLETGPQPQESPLAIPVETATGTELEGGRTAFPETTGATPTTPSGNGERRKPLISWRLQSDRTTSIELACWANSYRTQLGEEYEQLSFTIQRSFKDPTGTWLKGGSWRSHDLPVLTYLVGKAHAYAMDRRMTVTTECPF